VLKRRLSDDANAITYALTPWVRNSSGLKVMNSAPKGFSWHFSL
jgi:hypothetical protein